MSQEKLKTMIIQNGGGVGGGGGKQDVLCDLRK